TKSARKSRFSLVGGNENGLILNPGEFRPTRTYVPPKSRVRLSKLPPKSKMNVYGSYFCMLVMRKFKRNDLPDPVRPRIIVCATSRWWRFRKYGVLWFVSRTARYSCLRCRFSGSPQWSVKRKE